MESFDIIVIGAGPGGYPAAIRAAQLGASVAIVEREQMGGTCLNWGCIPTKLFIDAAKLYRSVSEARSIGLRTDRVAWDYAELVSHKDNTLAKMRAGVGQLLKANGVKVFTGTASFRGNNLVAVASPGVPTVELGAERFFIATGSTSSLPGFLPAHRRVLESRAFLAQTRLPDKLLVLGGGYIGCELACMAAQLGVQVTVVELEEEILPGLDADVRAEVRRYMESKLGVLVHAGKPLADVVAEENGVFGRCGDHKLDADLLLVAVGRRPFTEALALEAAGLAVNGDGFIEVNQFGQTRVPNIYAIGDVNGRTQLAHAATSQAIIAANHACGRQPTPNETLIPGVIFTSPEVGEVGLSEREALRRGLSVNIGKFPFAALGRSIASRNAVGFAKWVACPDTDRLLGATVVGPNATELVAEAVVAIRAGLKAGELGNTIHAHPTFSEAWMEAAHAIHGSAIHAWPCSKR